MNTAARLLHPTTAKEEKTYMPILLKGVLAAHGIKQKEWCDAIQQHAGRGSGKGLSLSAGTQLLNWDVWPRLTKKTIIKSQTETFLRQRGVPDQVIETIWQLDENDAHRNRHPVGVHRGQHARKAHSPFDDELPEAEMLSSTAKNHFRIFKDPFINDVHTADDLYLSIEQKYISESMFHAAKHGGFLAIIGESGAGKTTLRRALLERIHREQQPIIAVQPKSFDKTRLNARAICEAFIADVTPNASPRRTLEAMARQVEDALKGSSRAGNKHVLIIEEAHDLSVQTLKYLKRFWEMEDGYTKLTAIILIGQPELKGKLDERQNWDAREVIRRCEIAELQPLNGNLEEYLALKFNRIDKSLEDIFAPDAYDALRARLTLTRRGGRGQDESMLYPLVVNIAVTKAMNAAAELGEDRVTAELIMEV